MFAVQKEEGVYMQALNEKDVANILFIKNICILYYKIVMVV